MKWAKKLSEFTQPVIDFIDVATRYCRLIESREDKTKIKLLQEAFIILPQLCLCEMKLPDIKRLSDYEETEIPHEQWNDISKSLGRKFKNHNYYKKMFDPYDRKDKKPVTGSLSDDLTDIYLDIIPGLRAWGKASSADRLNIIWYWKLGFSSHWG